jgi:hypothetical protein
VLTVQLHVDASKHGEQRDESTRNYCAFCARERAALIIVQPDEPADPGQRKGALNQPTRSGATSHARVQSR